MKRQPETLCETWRNLGKAADDLFRVVFLESPLGTLLHWCCRRLTRAIEWFTP